MSGKITIENWQWEIMQQQAAYLVGDRSLLRAIPGSSVYKFDEFAQRASFPHVELMEITDAMFLQIATMSKEDQDCLLEKLQSKGILKDSDTFYKRLADWNKRSGFGRAYPTPPCKMSDDILDRGTQYVEINRHLLDEYEQYDEEFQNS